MIEWIVGGILLLGAVGKKLAESDNSGASHIGNGLEKLSDGTKNKICEMGEARARFRNVRQRASEKSPQRKHNRPRRRCSRIQIPSF